MIKHIRAGAVALTLCALAFNARAQYSTEVMNLNPLVYYRLNDAAATAPFADMASNSSSLGAAANGFYVGGIAHPDTTTLIGGMTAETSISGGIVEMPFMSAWATNPVFGAEMWFNVNPGAAGVLCCNVNLDGRYGWILYYGEDGADIVSLRMYNGNGTAVFALATSPVMTESVWHHVVGQCDGTNAYIYIDGTNAATVATPPGYVPPSLAHACPFDIFGREDNSFRSTGYAAQVAIYTNTLSAAQVLNHYNTGIATSPSPNYVTTVLNDGAYGYWALNDPAYSAGTNPTAANSSTLGSAADGTYLPGTAPGAAGPPFAGMSGGGSCHFNGLSGAFDGDTTGTLPGYIDISAGGGGADGVTFGTNITMSCWIQRDAWVNDYQAILGNGDSSWRLERYAGVNTLQFGLNSSASGTPFFGVVNSVDQIADSVWHHVVGVYDGTNVSFYIDGVLDSKQSEPNMTINPVVAFASIGEDTGTGTPLGRVWDGDMSEIAIFTNALTPAQVTALYNSAQPSPMIMQPPTINPSPVYEGESITISAQANGGLPLYYQWTSNSIVISNQTTTNLALASVHPNYDASYALIVSNSFGVVTSAPAVLNVIAGPPVILTQPAATASRYVSGSATLSVVGVGAVPITYQWQVNSAPIAGATNSSLVLSGLGTANSGTYNVVLNNPHGTLTSSNEVLTVLVPTNYPSAVMALGPQAYWRLNETSGNTANDYANGFNGTTVGAVTVGQAAPTLPGLAGTGGGSYYFNGITGFVQTPLLVDGDQGTFIALVNTTNPVDLVGILDARGGPGSSCSLELYTDGVTLQYTWDNQADTYNYPPTVAKTGLQAAPDTWCLVAASVGEAETVLYLDNGTGLQSETNQVPALVVSNTGPMLIGRDTAWYFFPGWINEGAYFNRALSPAEIAALDSSLFSGTPVAAPQILVPPASQSAVVGSQVSLTVSAVGAMPLSYQWQLDNTNITGATAQTLVIPSVNSASGGSYTVKVSNSVGSSNSAPAVVTVQAAPITGSVTDGLVGHYKFDGDFTDSSGNNNNGLGINSPPFVPGKFGSAVIVGDTNAGFDQCVDLGYPADMQFNYGDDFSVTWWVNYTTACGDLPMIDTAGNSTYNSGWTFADSFYDDGGGNMEISFANGNGDYTAPGAYPINDGNWHNVAVTADLVNDVAKVYIDGTPVTNYFLNGGGTAQSTLPIPNALSGAVVYPGNPIIIGSDITAAYAGGQRGTYAIDDMGIWNRLLSPTEVSGIYAAGTNGMPIGSSSGGITLSIQPNGSGQLEISWSSGTLQSAPSLSGPWTPVSGAVAPSYLVTPVGTQFYRVH